MLFPLGCSETSALAMEIDGEFWRESPFAHEELIASNVRKKMRPFRVFLRRLLLGCQYGAAVALLEARHRAGMLLTTDEANECVFGRLSYPPISSPL